MFLKMLKSQLKETNIYDMDLILMLEFLKKFRHVIHSLGIEKEEVKDYGL